MRSEEVWWHLKKEGGLQNQIKGLVPDGEKVMVSDIFGYCSRGVPGLEIVGLGKRGRIFKEKLNFITRRMRVKIEAKKYVICIDDEIIEKIDGEIYRYLELPCLLLYWSLADVIKVKRLDDCLCGGTVSTSGVIRELQFKDSHQSMFEDFSNLGLKIITDNSSKIEDGCTRLSLGDLIGENFKIAS